MIDQLTQILKLLANSTIDVCFGRRKRTCGVKKNTKSNLINNMKKWNKNNVETIRHSQKHFQEKSRNLIDKTTCLTYYGVDLHLERQYKAQKEKNLVSKLLKSGSHRNMKKPKTSRLHNSRVTIPKPRYNRKFIREAMTIIK